MTVKTVGWSGCVIAAHFLFGPIRYRAAKPTASTSLSVWVDMDSLCYIGSSRAPTLKPMMEPTASVNPAARGRRCSVTARVRMQSSQEVGCRCKPSKLTWNRRAVVTSGLVLKRRCPISFSHPGSRRPVLGAGAAVSNSPQPQLTGCGAWLTLQRAETVQLQLCSPPPRALTRPLKLCVHWSQPRCPPATRRTQLRASSPPLAPHVDIFLHAHAYTHIHKHTLGCTRDVIRSYSQRYIHLRGKINK